MRTSRKSRTSVRENPFRSRFEGDADLFPLRQSMRCREEFVQRLVLSLVQAGFLTALVLLIWSIHRAFVRHGTHAAAWIEPACLLLVVFTALSLARKIVSNVRDALLARAEYKRLAAEIAALKDGA